MPPRLAYHKTNQGIQVMVDGHLVGELVQINSQGPAYPRAWIEPQPIYSIGQVEPVACVQPRSKVFLADFSYSPQVQVLETHSHQLVWKI